MFAVVYDRHLAYTGAYSLQFATTIVDSICLRSSLVSYVCLLSKDHAVRGGPFSAIDQRFPWWPNGHRSLYFATGGPSMLDPRRPHSICLSLCCGYARHRIFNWALFGAIHTIWLSFYPKIISAWRYAGSLHMYRLLCSTVRAYTFPNRMLLRSWMVQSFDLS